MGIFKGIAMSSLSLKADGSAVFYPLSIFKGYFVGPKDLEGLVQRITFEIRLYVGLLLGTALLGYFLPSALTLAVFAGAAGFCTLRYFLVVGALARGLGLVQERFKIKDSVMSALRGHSYLSLLFLIAATGYLGWEAWRNSYAQDGDILRVAAVFCWLFAAGHALFLVLKTRLPKLNVDAKYPNEMPKQKS